MGLDEGLCSRDADVGVQVLILQHNARSRGWCHLVLRFEQDFYSIVKNLLRGFRRAIGEIDVTVVVDVVLMSHDSLATHVHQGSLVALEVFAQGDGLCLFAQLDKRNSFVALAFGSHLNTIEQCMLGILDDTNRSLQSNGCSVGPCGIEIGIHVQHGCKGQCLLHHADGGIVSRNAGSQNDEVVALQGIGCHGGGSHIDRCHRGVLTCLEGSHISILLTGIEISDVLSNDRVAIANNDAIDVESVGSRNLQVALRGIVVGQHHGSLFDGIESGSTLCIREARGRALETTSLRS